jgi:sulfur carrier protein
MGYGQSRNRDRDFLMPIAYRLLPIALRAVIIVPMKVQLSHPDRQVEVKGPKRVRELLRDLNLLQEAHLVIRGDDLVTEDELLRDEDEVEVRPVISGGSAAWTG